MAATTNIERGNLTEALRDETRATMLNLLAAGGHSSPWYKSTEAQKSTIPTWKLSIRSKNGLNFVIANRAPSGYCHAVAISTFTTG